MLAVISIRNLGLVLSDVCRKTSSGTFGSGTAGRYVSAIKQTQIPQQEDWSISAVDLWSADLEKDLSISEETGQQGSITLAYANVIARHGNRLSNNQKRLLQAIVLSSKLGLVVSGKDDAITALGILSSVSFRQTEAEIKILQEDYNVIEWDDAFKAFDILGDAVPRTQFLSLIRQRVSSAYDEHGKGVLFASKASAWCELLADLDCDFAEETKFLHGNGGIQQSRPIWIS